MWVVKGVIAWGGGAEHATGLTGLEQVSERHGEWTSLVSACSLGIGAGSTGYGTCRLSKQNAAMLFVLGCVGDNGQVSGDVVGRVALQTGRL